jgi:hypothetical protein
MNSLELGTVIQRIIHFTDQHLFLTGKAGTGKTTILKEVSNSTHKRIAIVAPTGVAAINAGGVTIHSFLGIHPHTFLPWGEVPSIHNSIVETAYSLSRNIRLAQDKINVIKNLDVLIIDEISMVRCDLLDAIDLILRKYRDNQLPFGGVQLLMIGDLYQLPPVIKDEDARILSQCYPNFYFFESKALQKCGYHKIELMHVYRQTDSDFLVILNEIRHGKLSPTNRKELNRKVEQTDSEKLDDETIILSTHVRKSDEINSQRLENLKGKLRIFEAKVDGEFNTNALPAEASLQLKIGAQVMFIKNDKEKRYYNGKIGIVEDWDFENDAIIIRSIDDNESIYVTKETWRNVKYTFDDQKNTLSEDQKGTFEQYPLRLAWAITIHKSQGLTFDKVIIDAENAFVSGQVYVALSRCKSLEGIRFLSPIRDSDISVDEYVISYYESFEPLESITNNLMIYEFNHLYNKSQNAFDLKWLKPSLREAQEGIIPLLKKVDNELTTKITYWEEFHTHMIQVADNYRTKLEALLYSISKGDVSQFDVDRLHKAVVYFSEGFIQSILNPIQQIRFDFRKEKGVKNGINSLKQLELNSKSFLRKLVEIDNLLNAYLNRTEIESIKETFGTQMNSLFSKITFDTTEKQLVKNKSVKTIKKKKLKGETQFESLTLLKSGKSILDIAIERGLKTSTIAGHLCKFIENGELKIEEVIDYNRLHKLLSAIEGLGKECKLGALITSLKDEFEADEIKLALAHLQHIEKLPK